MKKRKILVSLSILIAFLLLTIPTVGAQPAQNSYEGEGFHTVTGESYPTNINVSGYDVKAGEYHLNFALETTKTVGADQAVTFSYVVEAFDGEGNSIGNLGTFDTPQTVAGDTAATTATIEDAVMNISSLPAGYRLVVTVTETAIA
ncbi:hypothetical protein [Garciella nitratireducens]|uniref:hypothetical protein n=1 Tax=Garciella nitratireducens TaxID=218205 RepID=UPI000DEAD6DD|nr:hypothetical protein [Garciella nitratireducens]RBP40272.1 hypothetical protein DFR81_11335 [Garciella nitratireducens]